MRTSDFDGADDGQNVLGSGLVKCSFRGVVACNIKLGEKRSIACREIPVVYGVVPGIAVPDDSPLCEPCSPIAMGLPMMADAIMLNALTILLFDASQ